MFSRLLRQGLLTMAIISICLFFSVVFVLTTYPTYLSAEYQQTSVTPAVRTTQNSCQYCSDMKVHVHEEFNKQSTTKVSDDNAAQSQVNLNKTEQSLNN